MRKLKFNQFGVMSVLYQQYSLEYCLDSLAANGFHYVDFWGGATHYCAFDTAPSQRQKRVLEIRKMLDDRGMEMSVFTPEQICLYPINIASSNSYVRKNSIQIVKNYLEDTKEFGAKYYFMQMGYGLFDENEEETYHRSVEALRELCEYAEKLNVKMVMEQLQKYECNICFNRQMLKKMVDDVDCASLAVCGLCGGSGGGRIGGRLLQSFWQ